MLPSEVNDKKDEKNSGDDDDWNSDGNYEDKGP